MSYQDFDVEKFLEKAKKEKRKKLKLLKPRLKRPFLKRPISRKVIPVTPASKFPHFQPTNNNKRRNYNRMRDLQLAQNNRQSLSIPDLDDDLPTKGTKLKDVIESSNDLKKDSDDFVRPPMKDAGLSIEMEVAIDGSEEEEEDVKRELKNNSNNFKLSADKAIVPIKSPVKILPLTQTEFNDTANFKNFPPVTKVQPVNNFSPVSEVLPVNNLPPVPKVQPVNNLPPVTKIQPVNNLPTVNKVQPVNNLAPVSEVQPVNDSPPGQIQPTPNWWDNFQPYLVTTTRPDTSTTKESFHFNVIEAINN